MVGVRSTVPVQGVSFILGNDLAGNQVMAEPCVSRKPQIGGDPCDSDLQIPDVFPSCAVTRAMAHRKQESAPQLNNASIMNSGCGAADDDQLILAEAFVFHDSNNSTEVEEEQSTVEGNADQVLTRDQLIKDQ